MIKLKEFKDDFNKILEDVSNTTNFDAALFDNESRLVTCTKLYLKQKGNNVHASSIQEVITNGKVLVNKPGYMKSCIGCRFKEHCPSTIEILNCIKMNDETIGVISLTSFTKEGYNRMSENVNLYIEILDILSVLIVNFVSQKNNYLNLHNIYQKTLELSNDNFLIIDNDGYLNYIDSSSIENFSFCELHSKSIHQILPEKISNNILKGNYIKDKKIEINNSVTNISSVPLKVQNNFSGAIIKISQNISKKTESYTPDDNYEKSLANIKGNSSEIQQLKTKIKKIANSSSTILITGKTGTGKGLLAKSIHNISNRSNFRFVTINCASIPETLLESELFGYEEGAFTGAKKGGKIGRFELANGGTLFLDEIGEMPLNMQAKLLTVLQDDIIERVGGITPIPIDVRIITATNQDLEQMIKEKKFREDLFYRLNVIPLNLPPLCHRKKDIIELSNDILRKYNLKLHKNVLGFSNETLSLFMSYDWPGNIRELENIIEYCVNMVDGDIINITDLPQKFLAYINNKLPNEGNKLKNIEIETIKAALDKYGWDVKGKTEAAKELGIGLRTLYRKLKCENN